MSLEMKFEVQVFVSCFAFGVALLTSSIQPQLRCLQCDAQTVWSIIFFSLNVFSRLFPRWICHMNPSLLGNLFVVNTKRDKTKTNNNIKSNILAIKSWASCCLYPLTFLWITSCVISRHIQTLQMHRSCCKSEASAAVSETKGSEEAENAVSAAGEVRTTGRHLADCPGSAGIMYMCPCTLRKCVFIFSSPSSSPPALRLHYNDSAWIHERG